jgi:hypothetical protein
VKLCLAALAALATTAFLFPAPASAQNCTGVGYFEACLDAIGGRPMDGSRPRDPSRIVDDIFRTTDTPPRFAPQLTFGRLVVDRSTINSPGCSGGVSSFSVPGYPSTDPRRYTAYACVNGVPPSGVPVYTDALDWRWTQNIRVRSDGRNATDQDDCGGNRALCGYESPWRGGMVFDLQGPANRVVVFPITDHVTDSCLEAFEYSVYLTDNPASTSFVRAGERPDPMRWNAAVLVRAYLRGWTNNYLSTGTVADMAVHPLTTGRDTSNEAIADSIATVWALPCGITFRYVSIVPGNYGNPDSRCAFHSAEDEFDAVAGLNEDGSAICPDRDGDGFRDARCGGNDCDDDDRAVNPGATEDCRTTRDMNCDRAVPSCPSGTACVNGLCAANCIEGACAEGFRCERPGTPAGEFCLPMACAETRCPPGQICGPRGCQEPCDGAVCPVGQVCLGGACVDVCAGVTCSTNQHCEAGRCVPNCSCLGCPAGRTCNMTSGRCEAPGCSDLPCPVEQRDCTGDTPRCVTSFCDGVRCPLGQVCSESAHACVVDQCFGVSCPSGLVCREGRCVAEARDAGPGPAFDAGYDAGYDAGPDPAFDAGTTPDAGRAMDARADARNTGSNASCACRAGQPSPRFSALGALGALAALLAARRRRA